jgi:hypothetical protein
VADVEGSYAIKDEMRKEAGEMVEADIVCPDRDAYLSTC